MRQILFRGKTIDSGRWAKGYLVQGQWYYDDKPMTVIIPTDITFYPRCEIGGYEDVDPNTIGQWTGLVDKNGKKIFEGDIVEYNDEYGIVEYGHFNCGCCYDVYGFAAIDCEYLRGVIVVGNKWDNPELVGGTSK